MQLPVEFSRYDVAKRTDGNIEGTISAARKSISLLERETQSPFVATYLTTDFLRNGGNPFALWVW